MRLSLTQELKIHDDIVFLKTKVEPGMVILIFNPSQQHEEETSISLRWEVNAFFWALWAPSMHVCTYIKAKILIHTFFFKNKMQTFKQKYKNKSFKE